MALSAERVLARRGNEPTRNEFAYPVHAGVKIYRGAMVAINSSGEIIIPPASGGIAVLGIADRTVDNSAGSGPSTVLVTPQKGTFPLTVGSATAANISAPVYASDDGTLTLTAGTLTQAGVLVGIEGGQTFVSILNS
jgi:hypothetical protein